MIYQESQPNSLYSDSPPGLNRRKLPTAHYDTLSLGTSRPSSTTSWSSSTGTLAVEYVEAKTYLEEGILLPPKSADIIDDHGIYNSLAPSRRSAQLDPNAMPFFPNPPVTPARVLYHNYLPITTPPPSLPNIRISTDVSFRRQPSWYPVFQAGANASFTSERERLALELITQSGCMWTPEDIEELTGHFCRKAQQEAENYYLSLFALKIYQIFDRMPGSDTPVIFRWHLEEAVVGTFLARWNPDFPRSITYKNKPTCFYVASSLFLGKFIGNLFSQGLLTRSGPLESLRMVFGDLNSIERLEAVRYILIYSGNTLWHGGPDFAEDLNEFSVVFSQLSSRLRPDMSILGQRVKPEVLGARIKQVMNLIQGMRAV